ncbi:MAG: methionyl-tRNA formyltransferase [Magnetospirillum sp. WYHS-4]
MRLAFMGSPDFSVPILESLLAAGHHVACVYSQPPKPAGRGHKERPCPVHAFAAGRGLPVRTPRSLKDAEAQAAFAALGVDLAVVAAYGLILPKKVLEAPRLGCLNVHASLLPRWRGAAPIQRAILAGDRETGITIMRMDEGLDTGAMLIRETVPIAADTTASGLHDTLAALGARLIVEALAHLPELEPVPQPTEGVTYAKKLDKDEGRIDWTLPAVEIERRVRALNPWPGVWCEDEGVRLKILSVTPTQGSGEPGRVLDSHLAIACGTGALRIVRLQKEGKSALDAETFLRGSPLPVGRRLK